MAYVYFESFVSPGNVNKELYLIDSYFKSFIHLQRLCVLTEGVLKIFTSRGWQTHCTLSYYWWYGINMQIVASSTLINVAPGVGYKHIKHIHLPHWVQQRSINSVIWRKSDFFFVLWTGFSFESVQSSNFKQSSSDTISLIFSIIFASHTRVQSKSMGSQV